jgi:hypothetical protein
MSKDDRYEIDASPTKELFIFMLVRDIPLIRAILDLIDNAIDGAHRSHHNGDYSKFTIRIEINKSHFKIVDNCGGISVDIARDYAFRFGRPENIELTHGSIGKFGVGMKRTFFKLGKIFKVISVTTKSRFVVEEDVDKWRKNQTNWSFRFKELDEENEYPADQIGTNIEISSLYDNVSNSFDLENFRTSLIQEIETAHSLVMDKGLVITLNSVPLRSHALLLLKSDHLKPAFFERTFVDIGPSPVIVKIYAGLSDRSKSEGGWYVFCNGRMVLEADQSGTTGWGEGDEAKVPKYHPDFAFFRGYVFFDSDDAELLPWTTTKTGVDTDSSLYKSVRLEMINIMKPILDFLRKLANERAQKDKGEISESPLEELLESPKVKYSVIKEAGLFSAQPRLTVVPAGPPMASIQYVKTIEEINKVKKILKISSNKAVGEKTFEYFLANEVD